MRRPFLRITRRSRDDSEAVFRAQRVLAGGQLHALLAVAGTGVVVVVHAQAPVLGAVVLAELRVRPVGDAFSLSVEQAAAQLTVPVGVEAVAQVHAGGAAAQLGFAVAGDLVGVLVLGGQAAQPLVAHFHAQRGLGIDREAVAALHAASELAVVIGTLADVGVAGVGADIPALLGVGGGRSLVLGEGGRHGHEAGGSQGESEHCLFHGDFLLFWSVRGALGKGDAAA